MCLYCFIALYCEELDPAVHHHYHRQLDVPQQYGILFLFLKSLLSIKYKHAACYCVFRAAILLLLACVCPPMFFICLIYPSLCKHDLWCTGFLLSASPFDASFVDFQQCAFLHPARTYRLYITSIDGRGRTEL